MHTTVSQVARSKTDSAQSSSNNYKCKNYLRKICSLHGDLLNAISLSDPVIKLLGILEKGSVKPRRMFKPCVMVF